ncbi:MAG: DUF58 domain-containing protein [Pseudomonadota bacterium]
MSTALETPDALLKRLEWTVTRPLDGLLQGDHRAWWRGVGLDLADLREYQPHDDVRHIDWNVTARMNAPYVRQYMEDRDLSLWLLMDLSGSMQCGSGGRSKWQVAREFAGVMGRLCTRHGNRVGALLYGQQVEGILPARTGRQQVLHLLQRIVPLSTGTPRTSPATPAHGTRLCDLLDGAQRALRRRSCVLVVSDFISDGPWPAALSRLSIRHDVTAIRLTDPLDAALPACGWVTVTDAETGEQVTVDSLDPGLQARYTQAAAAHEARLQEALMTSGVDTLELATDAPLLEQLLRFTDLRQRTHRFTPARRGSA